jgi:hypothetical protein
VQVLRKPHSGGFEELRTDPENDPPETTPAESAEPGVGESLFP